MTALQHPCAYCGASAGHPCSGYGLVDGDIHEARQHGTTKAADVVEMGRARALLGCSSSMSLLEGVRRASARLTEQMAELAAEKRTRAELLEALERLLHELANGPATSTALREAHIAAARAKGEAP